MKDEELKMDANRLIAEVYKRPALWNQRHISYHNREVTNRIWSEIASIFKLPKPMLKSKWKGLRDTFRAELKKEEVYRKSKFHRNRPLWIHFKSLQFLKDQMVPRPPIWERSARGHDRDRASESEGESQPSSNRTSSIDGDALEERLLRDAKIDAVGQIDVKQEPDEAFHGLEFQNVTDVDNEMMLQNISPEQVLMENDSHVPDPLEGSRFDDNYYFLMSLLPHIRTLSADRRMLLRMQMQELVYKEVYKKGNNDDADP